MLGKRAEVWMGGLGKPRDKPYGGILSCLGPPTLASQPNGTLPLSYVLYTNT